VFMGSPPLAFTFGLGGLLLFPMAVGASTVLLEKASPPQLAEAIPAYGVTVLFTAPTSYRLLSAHGPALRQSALRQCVSAGEALPAATRAQWKLATGIELIDGIGATELLHIFISADEAHARPGATGTVVPGYVARCRTTRAAKCPPAPWGAGREGPHRLPLPGRRAPDHYVKNGWNLTGDAYLMDADGYFFYQARTDDMIVSAGYNVASPEVEEALMLHPAVAECAVIGVPDAERGQVITAFVVPQAGVEADDALVKTLQDFVKSSIAPYKYPRVIRFADTLPRTQTGKLQRFRLHDLI
jgi:2-aminobenzoate-CoA ligase